MTSIFYYLYVLFMILIKNSHYYSIWIYTAPSPRKPLYLIRINGSIIIQQFLSPSFCFPCFIKCPRFNLALNDNLTIELFFCDGVLFEFYYLAVPRVTRIIDIWAEVINMGIYEGSCSLSENHSVLGRVTHSKKSLMTDNADCIFRRRAMIGVVPRVPDLVHFCH